MRKRTASLSLDMDNAWAYLKAHGDSGWRAYPSYLPVFVPIALDFFAQHDLKITFMAVGQDVVRETNYEGLRQIVAAGHEIGNHSFNHEAWMQSYGEEQVVEEISNTDQAITEVTGRRPMGFRGPGYACSETILVVLQRLGYQYDSSLLPSILNPIARFYYLWGTKMSEEEKRRRRDLFGHFRDALAPLRPFEWRTPAGNMLEIPITTMPCFRVPFHLSYLLWLSRFSRSGALLYLRLGLFMCRLRSIEPSYLMHPLDFLGAEDAPELAFFPGMDLSRRYKLEFAERFLKEFQRHFAIVSICEHVRRLRVSNRLKEVESAGLRNGRLPVLSHGGGNDMTAPDPSGNTFWNHR